MLLKHFVTVAILVLLVRGGFSQCYTDTACTGATVAAADKRECCVGTDNGNAFSDGGACTACIVHGFEQAVYEVNEGGGVGTAQLVVGFKTNVKGTTSMPGRATAGIGGTLRAETAGTATTSDFVIPENVQVSSDSAQIEIFTSNDQITLEYDDRILVRFRPTFPDAANSVTNAGEYIRDRAIVNIIDDDALDINFEVGVYSIEEGENLTSPIRLLHRNNQNSFTITLRAVDIATAEETGLGDFIISNESRATLGADFSNSTVTLTIPAADPAGGPQTYPLDQFFTVEDDDIDEILQIFAVVAEIGPDVPDGRSCFQIKEGDSDCNGRLGAAQINIVDNDRMLIGFSERYVTVSERTPEGVEFVIVNIDVHSLRTSEQLYPAMFRLVGGTAIIEDVPTITDFDVLFGSRENDSDPNSPIQFVRFVLPLTLVLSAQLQASVRNDFRPEMLECFTISILSPDRRGDRDIFDCYSDAANKSDYFCLTTICIEDNDESFLVAFVKTTYTVMENAGSVEVCVNLTRPEIDILDESVNVFVIDNSSSVYIPDGAQLATPDEPDLFPITYPMAEGSDFQRRTNFIDNFLEGNKLIIRQEMRIVCYNQTIYDDLRLEPDEYAGLTLGVRINQLTTVLTEVHPMYDQASILILDKNMAVVGLEKTFYSFSEGVGVVEVCAVMYSPNINCPIAFPFSVSLSTRDGSARSTTDYVALVSTILMFDTCENKTCTLVTIVDDTIPEKIESFNVTLGRTPGLDNRITLDPVNGECQIIDDDGAVVGLERTFYSVSEGDPVVRVCAVVYMPDTTVSCPISFPFSVALCTGDNTAEAPMDYGRLVDHLLNFNACQRQSCVDIPIVDDEVLEDLTELFSLTLKRPSGLDDSISLSPVDGMVQITDDDDAVVGLVPTFYQVTEGVVDVVELCAVVHRPDIACPIDFSFDVEFSTIDDTAVSSMDYGLRDLSLPFAVCEKESCVNVAINDDSVVELAEIFFATLERNGLNSRISLNLTRATIEILDNNRAVVGLETTSYSVTEGVPAVTVCAVVYMPDNTVSCPISFPFSVALCTGDITAEAPMDYGQLVDHLLNFTECQRKSCVDIPIVDDEVLELVESFSLTLERPSGLDSRITLSPVDGTVDIIDNDDAQIGLERTFYSSTEEIDPFVRVCTIVYLPTGICPIEFEFTVNFLTSDITAVVDADYIDSDTTHTFAKCQNRTCVNVPIVDDSVHEMEEIFRVSLGTPSDNRIIVSPPVGTIQITDTDRPLLNVTLVNDTVTGDPLMTVPIFTTPPDDSTLCYEVHGEANKYFNLISDNCVAVTAHYSPAAINNPNITLNVIDAVGVRAVATDGTCVNIEVGLQGCSAAVDGVSVTMYRVNGVVVRRYSNRVRITVPNCGETDLVMWIFCTSGSTEDPFTWQYFSFNFLRFVVMRGLNLDESSHGLLGQFWNVQVDVEEHTDTFNGVNRSDDYKITVRYPGSPARSFVGLRASVTWEFEKKPCLYVGNSQAGPLGEEVDPNDSVIEGTYKDYTVVTLFSPRFKYAHVDENNCMTK